MGILTFKSESPINSRIPSDPLHSHPTPQRPHNLPRPRRPPHPRAASSPPDCNRARNKTEYFPAQSTRPEKSPPDEFAQLRECPVPSPPCRIASNSPHRERQTKNPAPPPDTFPEARTSPSAARSHAVAPDQSPPEKHPAAISAPPPRLRRPAQIAPPRPIHHCPRRPSWMKIFRCLPVEVTVHDPQMPRAYSPHPP